VSALVAGIHVVLACPHLARIRAEPVPPAHHIGRLLDDLLHPADYAGAVGDLLLVTAAALVAVTAGADPQAGRLAHLSKAATLNESSSAPVNREHG
jgi:hypothetical protein